ncbi:hypothetical protein [Xanthomonas hortorum]|uniref:Uncharacterized protein n=1 Tax=Xanthomonas hortorum pv. carotae TaxID=487904 RepID=A0A6V7BGM1_9XANT|nr:hypothetical protein [Xanthomonas hortorum]CAD0301404.1 hypothetical protein CFBP7900_01020 [Xanthomonas hortorum pv. carotae]CAD0301412.1 hypothetical protein CFBP7900_01020 [Xanthomonas hortorum pv. carotae]
MSTIDAKTHQSLNELRGHAKAWQLVKAEELFRILVLGSDHATLTLVSHDLLEILEEFQKRRKRDLSLLLQQTLERGPRHAIAPTDASGIEKVSSVFNGYQSRMAVLADKHIFQWATYYRDNCTFILKDVVSQLPSMHDYTEAEDRIQAIFADHSREIFSKGYEKVQERGLPHEIGLAKSIRGLQQFLNVIVGVLRDQREGAPSKPHAAMQWDIASAMISGILLGYRSVASGDLNGRELLSDYLNTWLPTLGFCRGRHAILLTEPGHSVFNGSEASVCSLLMGVDRWASQASTPAVLPKYSRVTIGLSRLDITYSMGVDRVSQDVAAAVFFGSPLYFKDDLADAAALADVVVAELTNTTREWVDSSGANDVVDSSDVQGQLAGFSALAETVAAILTGRSAPASAKHLSGRLLRNYAKDFPLDDPLFREGHFEVERHSVNRIIQGLQRGVGAYVWCSVRRSGKTTSAEAIAGPSGERMVIFQSMDHRPNSPELNLLSSRIRSALEAGNAIQETFFTELVADCVVATTQANAPKRNLVLIIDEYEMLFEIIDTYTERSPGLKALVSLPLISQMLGFSIKNTLLFMGQRPDAHMILLSQNQLSPNVRQYAFPLFEHQPGTSSEFAILVSRILGENLRITDPFVEAVYQETKGHPYLTVNVLVDFCEWLMASTDFELGTELGGHYFAEFSRERLEFVVLRNSPHYRLFHKMLAEFSSERSRAQEPWLYSVTSILREIVRRHPKRMNCSLAAFDQIAKPFEELARNPSRQLLASAAMANFFNESKGTVSVGIPLMARLAATSTSRSLS